MGPQEIISMATEFVEDRANKPDLDKWLALEVARIVNKKDWWWKRKYFTLTSQVGQATYNLGDTDKVVGNTTYTALNLADDFKRMIWFYRKNSNTDYAPLVFESDAVGALKLLTDTQQAEPTKYIIQPGTTKVLRLGAIPSIAQDFVGYYEAGVPLESLDEALTEIPLIPSEHHELVLFAMLKRLFLYLYGQEDPRYVAIAAEFKEAWESLENYKSPATEEVVKFDLLDASRVVRSTRA